MNMRLKSIAQLSFAFGLSLFSLILSADELLPAEDRLRSCDSNVAIAAAKEILVDEDTLFEPLEMFSPAIYLFLNGKKDEAVFWFYAAQLRTRYQLVFENGDRGQLMTVMMMTSGFINNYAFQNLDRWSEILDQVIEWDKTTFNPHRKLRHTTQNDKEIVQIYVNFAEMKQKIMSEKSDNEKKARIAAPQFQSAIASYKCEEFPRPTKSKPVPVKPSIKDFSVTLGMVSNSWRYADLKRFLHSSVDDEAKFSPMLKRAEYLGAIKGCSKVSDEDVDSTIRGGVRFSSVCTFAHGRAKATSLLKPKSKHSRSNASYEIFEFDVTPIISATQ